MEMFTDRFGSLVITRNVPLFSVKKSEKVVGEYTKDKNVISRSIYLPSHESIYSPQPDGFSEYRPSCSWKYSCIHLISS